MSNYIVDNKQTLKYRHYLLLANQEWHWFNASPGPINRYQLKCGDNFCLVLYRNKDQTANDAYVIPFRSLKQLFTERNLVPGSNDSLRWHGTIKDGYLNLKGGIGETIAVAPFHNAFDLLSNPEEI